MEQERKFLLSEQAFLKTGGRLDFGRNLNLIDFEVFEFNLQLLVGLVKTGEKLHKIDEPLHEAWSFTKRGYLRTKLLRKVQFKAMAFIQIANEQVEQFAPCLM